MYNFGGAILPKYANGGVSTKLWAQGAIHMKYAGYKKVFIRASSRVTTKMIVGFGGYVVKTIHLK